jgi:hypothetical protein
VPVTRHCCYGGKFMRPVGAQFAAPWLRRAPPLRAGDSCGVGAPEGMRRGLPCELLPALLAFPADTRPRHGVQASFRDATTASLTNPEAALLGSRQRLFNGAQQVALRLAQAGLDLGFRLRACLVDDVSPHVSCGRGRRFLANPGSENLALLGEQHSFVSGHVSCVHGLSIL